MPEILIVGNPEDLADVPGGATVISKEEILKFNQSDIQRILRSVPGVAVQIEDGYGLRPNLSIRGTASERSARITLLEDGILIAPAPYSAPAAYYFPTAGRLAGVEVLKGPAAISEGPYTIGGAINLLSTPIPNGKGGVVDLQAGQDTTWRLQANYGEDDGKFGWLVETHQWQSDGYQELDTGDDTGLSKEDYMAKFRYSFGGNNSAYQQLDLKLHHANEVSQQSYLGLSDQDFSANPFRRYGISSEDEIDTEHNQILLRHLFQTENFELTTSVYYNDYERDWFKTEGLDITGSPDAQSINPISWFQVVQAVNSNLAIGPATPEILRGILNGADTATGAVQIRSNAREYYSRGVEFDARWSADLFGATHEFSAGIRRHYDHEERLQRNSTYTQTNGQLVLADLGLLGNAGNAEQDAEVWAFWIRDTIEFGNWQLSPGIRYEQIDQDRVRYETRAGQTADPSSRAASNVRDERENNIDVWIPGFGAVYQFNDQWSSYAGAHKGFSAPSNAPGVNEEESINYEFGVRYARAQTYADLGVFLTDYDNLVGTCTASSGVNCEVGDAFDGDAATVAGLEFSLYSSFSLSDNLTVPLQVAFTFIDAEFDSDIANTDFFGDVQAGDPLPYIPETQLQVSSGLESNRWGWSLSLNYVDEACVRASCGEFERIDSSTQFDTSLRYYLSDSMTLSATIENLSDEADIVARTPYGARPNKERSAFVGFRLAMD
ncbi:MAG: TonB-dependent receptor [Pseudomonadota bacterium]